MYNVIAIFPRILEMSDVQAIKYLAEAKTVKGVNIELSDILDFCRIGLGAKDFGEVDAYKLMQCKTLTTLMMSPWRPIFCVRPDEEVLEVTSLLGQQLVMAEHVQRPLAVIKGHAHQAHKLRAHLKLSNDENAIELIDNQLIPFFERQLEELINYCREFYAARAHTEV
jgi:hypothetical protein